ncbi:recombination directionality factor [Kitasatospora purpeofusca]|uniref:recombination directionality factor n=1 Tax=Kitasatospora purpeofusca TaxID=67352 RepID=UPI0036AF647F
MALRIFDTDPDAKPRPRQSYADDVVGRFRSGRMVGRRPESLSEWRVTTGDPLVASRIAALFGGKPEEWDTDSEESTEILTTASTVRVVIAGTSAISSDMRLYGATGSEPLHWCDGVEFQDDEQKGQPCGCPELLADRKALAKTGKGPKPNISLIFKLEVDPGLGLWRFRSGSWSLASHLHETLEALDAIDGPAVAELKLEYVEFEIKRGPKKGTVVSYTEPVIKVIGACAAAGDVELPAAA